MATFTCPSGSNVMNLEWMQPEAVAYRSIKSVIRLLCEHTVGHKIVANSHEILDMYKKMGAKGIVYLIIRFKIIFAIRG